MQKLIEKTTLYELINAGHLARQTMLVPLAELSLSAGDDAILFALSEKINSSEAITQITGLQGSALTNRLLGLEKLGLIKQKAKNISLTKKGKDVCDILIANWEQLDEALIGELDEKNRKMLQDILKRFVKLLSL